MKTYKELFEEIRPLDTNMMFDSTNPKSQLIDIFYMNQNKIIDAVLFCCRKLDELNDKFEESRKGYSTSLDDIWFK